MIQDAFTTRESSFGFFLIIKSQRVTTIELRSSGEKTCSRPVMAKERRKMSSKKRKKSCRLYSG